MCLEMNDRFRGKRYVYRFWTPPHCETLNNINVKLISGFTGILWNSKDEECANVHVFRPVIQQGIFQPEWKNIICVWIFSPPHPVSPLINISFCNKFKRSLCIVFWFLASSKMFVGQTVFFWEITMHWWELSNNWFVKNVYCAKWIYTCMWDVFLICYLTTFKLFNKTAL